MRRFILFFGFVGLLVGCKGPGASLNSPTIVDVRPVDEGRSLLVVFSPVPVSDTLVFRCPSWKPFDTLVLTEERPSDSLTYLVDSTFLLRCHEHGKITVFTNREGTWTVELTSDIPYTADTERIVFNGKDTLFLRRDSMGYVVEVGGYLRIRRYAGGIYAPVPPDGYDTLLSVGHNDTLVVWVDYDRDGIRTYDGDDVFWIVFIGDSLRAKTLSRRHMEESRKGKLTGYRGLDLCFECMGGHRPKTSRQTDRVRSSKAWR